MKKVLLSALAASFILVAQAQQIENEAPRKVQYTGTKKVFGTQNSMTQNSDKALANMWVDYSVASLDDFLTGWPFNSNFVLADTVGPGINNLFSKAGVGITGALAGYTDYIDLDEKFTSLTPSFSSVIENVYPAGYNLVIDTFYVGFAHNNQTGDWNYFEPTIVSLAGNGTPSTNVLWTTKDSVNTSQTADLNSIGLFQWPVGLTIAPNQKAGLTFRYNAPKADSLFLAGGGLDGDDNQVIENPTSYANSWMGLVYLSNGAFINTSNVGFGNPVGSDGWFFAQNWWIWAYVTYVDNSGINENEVYGFNIDPIYPNPFGGLANIRYSLTESAEVSFEILDLTGKVLRNTNLGTQAAGSYTMDVQKDNLAAGVYLYSFTVNGNKITKRMIVQ